MKNLQKKKANWHDLPEPKPPYNEWLDGTEEYKAYNEYNKSVIEAENKLCKKWGDLSDFYRGYTKSRYGLVGMGHPTSYWRSSGMRSLEAFAECASAKATNPESYAVLKKYVPNVVKGFEEIYEALKSRRIKTNVGIKTKDPKMLILFYGDTRIGLELAYREFFEEEPPGLIMMESEEEYKEELKNAILTKKAIDDSHRPDCDIVEQSSKYNF